MNIIEIALALLLMASCSVALAPRSRLPLEVILLLGSLIISLIPGLPRVTLEPDIVFLLFLPPILFAAAYFTSWRDFKANARPISLLAIGLVLFTTVGVAVIMKHLIHDLSWASAFILGAMVSPPDASAATSITRKLGVPRRLVTLLEGESLVNDATALVAYRFALGAALTGLFSLWQATLQFVWVGVGGVLVGWLIAKGSLWLFKKLKDSRAQVLLTLLTAFAAYSIGEHLRVSGVISTVTAGLIYGRYLPIFATAQIRVDALAAWNLVLFIVNGFVFTLIGLQLPQILDSLWSYSPGDLLLYAFVLNIVIVIIRFAWVFPATYLPRWISPSLRRKDPSPSWKIVTVLSYTGMRGIVSLASALALPLTLPSGQSFPHRDILLFLTYTVILTTLLIPALTLPWLLKKMDIKADGEADREEALARLAIVESVVGALEKPTDRWRDDHVLQVKTRYERRLKNLRSNMEPEAYSSLFDEDQQFRRLMRDVIRLEREALNKLRMEGQVHDDIVHQLGRELDFEELRLLTRHF